jgi:hydrogenase nickel incorporation protein HypB
MPQEIDDNPSLAQRSSDKRTIEIETRVLSENDRIAAENRSYLKTRGILALNLISSPGSGKTSLLTETLKTLGNELRCAVIEGDQQTDNDARRIAETGAPVAQINTRQGCHLEAHQVRRAFEQLPMNAIDLLFIENVGNLVCPAEYDLGEAEKIVLMSVTEGEDKPEKYPLAFHLATALVITKIDLLPYLHFDLELCKTLARRINPRLTILETSVFNPAGIQSWLDWLRSRRRLDLSG